MLTYLILQNPGHNRVYYNLADKLALAELQLASLRMEVSCTNIRIVDIAAVRYLAMDCERELSEADLQIISRLSFAFALFQLDESAGKQRLIPIAASAYQYVDDKISSLLKYQGKTNELFTKMMVNVALLSSDFKYDETINLLDPVAGKGTTLFESSVYGFNSYGIEIEPKSVQEATLFFKKYIETERYKHKADKRMISGKSKADAVYIQEFEYARDKEEFKSESLRKKLAFVNGNTNDAANYFKSNFFNLIVGDLPYGIAHGNTGVKKTGSITRNPSELLDLCLPGWNRVLKKGGCIVLAWNSFVVSKHKLTGHFNNNGFEVLSEAPYDQFEHMVDKSIKRDIVVARKI
nr:hypothetical protein [uncultured Carboxylicivirga sp.]